VIEVLAEIAPMASIMVADAKALLKYEGRRLQLEPLFDHKGIALEGARTLGFMFRMEEVPANRNAATVTVSIKLTDGAKRTIERNLSTAHFN